MYTIEETYLDLIQNESFLNEQIIHEFSLINVEKITDSYEKSLNVAKKFLKEHGVSIKYLETQGKKAVNLVRSSYKKKKSPSFVSDEIISEIIKPTLKRVLFGVKHNNSVSVVDFGETNTKENDIPLASKVLSSIIIFCIIIICNTFIMILGTVFFGPMIGYALAAVISAPLCEEYAKRVSILSNFPYVYTAIFAGLEAYMYITKLVSIGMPIPTAIISRLIAFAFHWFTMLVQKHFHEKEEANKFLNENLSITGYWIAVGLHALYNSIAIVPMLIKHI